MVIRLIQPRKSLQPYAELQQLLRRCTPVSTIYELHNPRSGAIVDGQGCAISFHAVIPCCSCSPIRQGHRTS